MRCLTFNPALRHRFFFPTRTLTLIKPTISLLFSSTPVPTPKTQKSIMASIILSILHAFQAAYGAYNLYLSSISIRNLQGYENTSKKAAKYSNTAADQLHKTRTTQASTALAVTYSNLTKFPHWQDQILFSLISSVSLTLYSSASAFIKIAVAGANIAVLGLVRQHVGRFWKGKARLALPGAGDYNEATKMTQEVRLNMAYLMASWALAGVFSLVFWRAY